MIAVLSSPPRDLSFTPLAEPDIRQSLRAFLSRICLLHPVFVEQISIARAEAARLIHPML
jgi:hypothetical protein